MKNLIFILTIIVICVCSAHAQKSHIAEEKIGKQIQEVLSEFSYPKDSLAIYALNFTLKMGKKGNAILPTAITANDSLAYKLFPSYKKLAYINFSPILGTNAELEVVIPILVYGSSPQRVLYKDENGQPLINFNSAINAALALNSDKRYDNLTGANEMSGFFKVSKRSRIFRNIIFMEPYIVHIINVK